MSTSNVENLMKKKHSTKEMSRGVRQTPKKKREKLKNPIMYGSHIINPSSSPPN